MITTCKQCQKEGHHSNGDLCPARAPQEIQDSVEVFWGGKFPLSNLYKCPKGCHYIDKDGETYVSSEHHYQRAKLMAHNKRDVAEEIMQEENPFKVI